MMLLVKWTWVIYSTSLIFLRGKRSFVFVLIFFCFVCLGATHNSDHGLLLAQYSEISADHIRSQRLNQDQLHTRHISQFWTISLGTRTKFYRNFHICKFILFNTLFLSTIMKSDIAYAVLIKDRWYDNLIFTPNVINESLLFFKYVGFFQNYSFNYFNVLIPYVL